jgi:NAD(P)-dependent dehydrogenase (short-subunit alcohol dehydrogenase family)
MKNSSMKYLENYRGQWALVTGAGDGIGRALTLGFAREGLNVIALDIRAEAAQIVAAEARALGVQARVLCVDVSDREAMLRAGQDLSTANITPAILWVNAGVGAGATIVEGSQRAIEWAISVNVLGVAWTAQAFVPAMLKASGLHHVGVTASSASITDVQGPYTLYAATKHGTAAFAEALSAELTPKGVGVTILYPGLLNTNIWNAARARPDRFGGITLMPETVGERWRQAQTPDIVLAPTFRTIAKGGGRVVVATDPDTAQLFDRRTQGIKKGFDA